MAKTAFPASRYDPVARTGAVFESADDVPDGWVARLPEPGEEPETPDELTRAEIVSALTEGGISFSGRSKTDALHALLRDELTKVLTTRGVEFDPAASTAALLALV